MLIDLSTAEREHCRHLIAKGGTGWHAYTLRKAEGLEARDPEFRGLTAAVEAEIAKAGPQAVDAARRAAKWMEGR
jgi:isoaspartyl peptidase/L-asparaginase-like protein (Ntn-hydrolase superfamily)